MSYKCGIEAYKARRALGVCVDCTSPELAIVVRGINAGKPGTRCATCREEERLRNRVRRGAFTSKGDLLAQIAELEIEVVELRKVVSERDLLKVRVERLLIDLEKERLMGARRTA